MRALKLFVLVSIIAIAIAVGCLFAFIVFLDPNDLKDTITEKVRLETGRTLSLEGDLEWAFYPKIQVKAGPLSLSNPEGFDNVPFFAADEIQIAVTTIPLLRKRIEMDAVKLHGAVINLRRSAEGTTNWEGLVDEKGESQPSPGIGVASIMLGGVDIRDARLTWSDAQNDQQVTISKFRISTGALRFGEPIDFDLSLSAVANQPAIDSDLKLTGTVAYDLDDDRYLITPLILATTLRGKHLDNGTATVEATAGIDINLREEIAEIKELELHGLGMEIEGELASKNIRSDTPSARGFLNINGSDMALLFNAFELPVGKQLAQISNRKFDFSVAFDADMDTGEITVSKFDGNALGAKLSGNFRASAANTDKLIATGGIAAEGGDLPTVMAVVGQLQGADSQTLENLRMALHTSKDKSFSVTAELEARMDEESGSLPTIRAKLLGNTINGEVHVRKIGEDIPAIKGALDASGPDLPSLLAIAAQFQSDSKALTRISSQLAEGSNKHFKIKTRFDTDIQKGNIEQADFSANLLGIEINSAAKGKGIDFEKATGTVDGRLNIVGKDLKQLLSGLGQEDLAKTLTNFTIEAGVEGNLSDLKLRPLKITAMVADTRLGKPMELKVSAQSARANFDDETLAVEELEMVGLGLDLKANVRAKNIKDEPEIEGDIDVPSFNLKNLLTTLNEPLPKTGDPNALTHFGLKTDFSGDADSIRLEHLDITLDQTSIQGEVNVSDVENPDIAFRISVGDINVDKYLEPETRSHVPPPTPEIVAVGAASALPIETLRALKLDGVVSIDSMTFSGITVNNIHLSAYANGGVIRLDPVRAELYAGNYAGTIDLDATGKQPRLSLKTNLSNVNIEPLMADVAGNRMLSGTIGLDAVIKAAGGDADRLKSSLNGTIQFDTNYGVFRGVDAIAVLRAVEQIIECKCPIPVPKGGETQFNKLTGTLNAKNGVIQNKNLLMSGDGFNIEGKGMLANLNNNSVKYDLLLSVPKARIQDATGSYNLGGFSVPIQCRGSLESPTCLPDFEDIVKRVASKAIQRKLGDKLKDALGDKAGEALKNIFKF